MGIKSFPNPIDSVRFAEYVIAHYGGGVGGSIPSNKQFEKECERLIQECKTINCELSSERIYLLAAAGDKIIDISSTKALGLKANCYVLAGATYRRKAIEFLTQLLSRIDRKMSDWTVWMDLGQSYEGEYEFENALHAYKKVYELAPDFYGCNLFIARIYKKMNNLDMAIQTLEKAKQNPLLKSRKYVDDYGFKRTTEDYSKMFDADLEDYRKKKLKGYIYKPRKKND